MNKNSLNLYFHDEPNTSLSIVICSLQSEMHIACREGIFAYNQHSKVFRYTAALRALCLLIIRHQIFKRAGRENTYHLEGYLAQLLEKSLQCDDKLLGSKKVAQRLCTRLITKDNTLIRINENILQGTAIKLFLNDKPCKALCELKLLEMGFSEDYDSVLNQKYLA